MASEGQPLPGGADTSPSSPSPPPPLSYEILATDDARRDALVLVADSIAQQRQVASLAVIFHPVCFVAVAIALTLTWRHARDLGTALTSCAGLAIAFLAAVRLFTSRYVNLAEAFRWRDFIAAAPDGARADDLVIGARFGDDMIGALVLRLEPPMPRHSPKKRGASAPSLQGGRGLIRAWTTKLRYRGKGVGGDLLRFAVATTRSACGDDAPVAFDPAHANSALLLHDMFNRPFRSRDEKARRALARALRDYGTGEKQL